MAEFAVKKICLVRISALGDTVHALALANGLKQGYPDARLTWITQSLPYEMVKHQSNIDRFIIFNGKGGLDQWKQLRNQLKNEHFDIAVIPQVSLRASFITALIRAEIKLGFDFKRSREFSWMFTNRRIPSKPPGHVQDQFFEFLEYLGISNYHKEWNFEFTPEERLYQKDFFNKIDRPVVSFVIATSSPEKDWYPKGYAEVMDYIDKKLDLQSMIVGGPSKREREMAKEIISQCRCHPVVALEKPIRNTLLQLAGSAMVVSPDTGPLHAAVALNVPTIGLYGPSDPRRCGPYEKYQDLLINKYKNDVKKEKVITRKLRKGRMLSITPEDVIKKLQLGYEKYIGQKKSDTPDP